MEDGRHHHLENEENHHDDHQLGLNGNQNNHRHDDESASEVKRAARKRRKRRRVGNDDAESMAQDDEEESINKDFAEMVNQMNIDKNSLLLDGLKMMIETPVKAELVRMWRILHVDYLRGRSNIAHEIFSLALSKAVSS
ncbi:hypothetical protein TorRG33x02_198930 [Trema orientale]|uniref:Uncharacterized protein n=1 Tax=Trema orientale TaxID=63057 RepID=A0A2P5EFM2_TREOI|nr:hypothetical protein TorRG33x02_198930 [Trema orientale]